jgi:hypothetical protein
LTGGLALLFSLSLFRGGYPGLLLPFCAALIIPALDAGSATGPLGYAHSILGLGFATVGGLSSCYSVLILMGDSSIARVRVTPGGSLTIAANGLTAAVFDAICSNSTQSKKHTRYHHQTFHLHPYS